MVRRQVLLPVLLACGCSKTTPNGVGGTDGGGFVLPDSGTVYDGGPPRDAEPEDPELVDSGPWTCRSACEDGGVCACLERNGMRECGCHERQGYQEQCDPQVPESCLWPFSCVPGRTVEGTSPICSDGRAGTPCSTAQDICNTSQGCVCLTTPLGTACTCQGDPGPNPLLCDRRKPTSCPEGTCVRVESPAGVFFICSDGSEDEPCEPGDSSCRTSLGCTCPEVASRPVCRCSEPGTEEGAPCDLSVPGSCRDPLVCRVRGNPIEGLATECAGRIPDGGSGSSRCEMRCPEGYVCVEVASGRFACRMGPS